METLRDLVAAYGKSLGIRLPEDALCFLQADGRIRVDGSFTLFELKMLLLALDEWIPSLEKSRTHSIDD